MFLWKIWIEDAPWLPPGRRRRRWCSRGGCGEDGRDTVAACGPSSSNVLAPTAAVSRTRCESFLSCSSSDPRDMMLEEYAGLDALEIGGFARLDVIRLSPDASLAGARLVSPKRTKPGQLELGEQKRTGRGFTRHEKATTDRLGFGAVSGSHRDAEAGERAHGERIHDVRSFVACVTCVSGRKCVDAPDPPSRIKRRNRKYLESDTFRNPTWNQSRNDTVRRGLPFLFLRAHSATLKLSYANL